MERLLLNLAGGLNDFAELTVIGPKGCSTHLPAQAKVFEVPARLAPFLLRATILSLKLYRQQRFDLIIGGSGIVAPSLRLLSAIYRCKTMLLVHGLDIIVASTLYQRLFVPCIRGLNKVVANSTNTRQLCIDKGIDPARISVINPGVSLQTIPGKEIRQRFRGDKGIAFDRYLLFVGRLTQRKGLSRFLRESFPAIQSQAPDLGLVVVGDDPGNSLNKLKEQAAILQAIEDTGLADSVLFLGEVDDQALQLCYSEAATLIFPLVDIPGDVEGFGMVAVEAAACGTPTVAFRLGGVEDAISEENGYLVPPGDYGGFTRAVLRSLDSETPSPDECVSFAQKFAWNHYHAQIRSEVERLT
tara:strand:- start:43405 stop:44475 length:1071 start_codon:yes stop_codon:yes gene_type:complete